MTVVIKIVKIMMMITVNLMTVILTSMIILYIMHAHQNGGYCYFLAISVHLSSSKQTSTKVPDTVP